MKAIQILCYQDNLGKNHTIALCDDGTIWEKSPYLPFWEQMPEVRKATQEEMDRLTERLMKTA